MPGEYFSAPAPGHFAEIEIAASFLKDWWRLRGLSGAEFHVLSCAGLRMARNALVCEILAFFGACGGLFTLPLFSFYMLSHTHTQITPNTHCSSHAHNLADIRHRPPSPDTFSSFYNMVFRAELQMCQNPIYNPSPLITVYLHVYQKKRISQFFFHKTPRVFLHKDTDLFIAHNLNQEWAKTVEKRLRYLKFRPTRSLLRVKDCKSGAR